MTPDGAATWAPCGVPDHAPCPDCEGEIVLGRLHPLRVQDGADPETGEVRYVVHQLPVHVLDLTHSRMDPTGLVASGCAHGLLEHPDPRFQGDRNNRWATSWVRSRYARAEGCVVDRGELRPDDLTVRADDVAWYGPGEGGDGEHHHPRTPRGHPMT